MKVISKEPATKIDFGDKVKAKKSGKLGDLPEGTVGVVLSNGVDYDGDIEVTAPDDCDYFKPADLEVLQKFSGEEVTAPAVTVEFDVPDIKFIAEVLAINAVGPLYRQFQQLLSEVA